jgi:hypothetical protein
MDSEEFRLVRQGQETAPIGARRCPPHRPKSAYIPAAAEDEPPGTTLLYARRRSQRVFLAYPSGASIVV